MKKKIILLLLCLLLSGCKSSDSSEKKNIYELNTDTTISEYFPLSRKGNDVRIPNMVDESWKGWQYRNDDCIINLNRKYRTCMYIIRKNSLQDSDGNYLKKLNEKQLNKIFKDDITEHIGNIEREKTSVTYIDERKFYENKGSVIKGNMKYRSIVFQSEEDIPSVSLKYVPTVILAVYEDEKDDDVSNMMYTLKKWMIKTE